MRALVTGAAGFVGRHLTAELLSQGHEVKGVVLPSDGRPSIFGSRVEYFPLDILDEETLGAVVHRFRPGGHFPSGRLLQSGGILEGGPANARNEYPRRAQSPVRGERDGAARLASFSSARRSSTATFRAEAQPISEEREQRPLTPYAVSKTSQEILGRRSFWAGELPVYLTRSFNHTGPGQTESYVSSSFARQIAEVEKGAREPVIRVGNLSARRDLSDVRDVVVAYAAIVERGQPGQPYNVCRGEAFAMGEVLDELARQSRVPVQVVVDPDRYHAVDSPLIVGDPTRLKTDTGWSPRYSLPETLRDLLDDWRERLK